MSKTKKINRLMDELDKAKKRYHALEAFFGLKSGEQCLVCGVPAEEELDLVLDYPLLKLQLDEARGMLARVPKLKMTTAEIEGIAFDLATSLANDFVGMLNEWLVKKDKLRPTGGSEIEREDNNG